MEGNSKTLWYTFRHLILIQEWCQTRTLSHVNTFKHGFWPNPNDSVGSCNETVLGGTTRSCGGSFRLFCSVHSHQSCGNSQDNLVLWNMAEEQVVQRFEGKETLVGVAVWYLFCFVFFLGGGGGCGASCRIRELDGLCLAETQCANNTFREGVPPCRLVWGTIRVKRSRWCATLTDV